MIVLDGKDSSRIYVDKLKRSYGNMKKENHAPHLAIICIGENPQSAIYIKTKIKMCAHLGFRSTYKQLPIDVPQEDVRKLINQFNQDGEITGIIIQLPLPHHLNQQELINCINTEKDVDGITPHNIGKLALQRKGLTPATPLGIMMLLTHYNISTQGKHIVILGRSHIVGKPLSMMLSNNCRLGNATVTLCHSRTKDVASITKQADILIVAVGVAKFLTRNMIAKGVTIIDVGIHKVIHKDTQEQTIVGDVDYKNVAPNCYAISPVPGGVGKMTVTALMYNLLDAFTLQHNINYLSPFSYVS